MSGFFAAAARCQTTDPERGVAGELPTPSSSGTIPIGIASPLTATERRSGDAGGVGDGVTYADVPLPLASLYYDMRARGMLLDERRQQSVADTVARRAQTETARRQASEARTAAIQQQKEETALLQRRAEAAQQHEAELRARVDAATRSKSEARQQQKQRRSADGDTFDVEEDGGVDDADDTAWRSNLPRDADTESPTEGSICSAVARGLGTDTITSESALPLHTSYRLNYLSSADAEYNNVSDGGSKKRRSPVAKAVTKLPSSANAVSRDPFLLYRLEELRQAHVGATLPRSILQHYGEAAISDLHDDGAHVEGRSNGLQQHSSPPSVARRSAAAEHSLMDAVDKRQRLAADSARLAQQEEREKSLAQLYRSRRDEERLRMLSQSTTVSSAVMMSRPGSALHCPVPSRPPLFSADRDHQADGMHPIDLYQAAVRRQMETQP